MKDPYSVLGVSRDATEDEIKSAYRALAKKYHPDNYVDSPLASVAEEKMKEINEAYDAIKDEKSGKTSGSYGNSYGNSYGGTYGGYSGSAAMAQVRTLIASGRYAEAEIQLESMSAADKTTAEWCFLKGCVLLRRGAFYDAARYIDRACYLDPNNAEYARAREDIRNSTRQNGTYRTSGQGDDICDFCTTLMCINCLCNCCGGGGSC